MYISHGYLARAIRNIGLDAPDGYEMLHSMTGNNRSVLLLPLSHVSSTLQLLAVQLTFIQGSRNPFRYLERLF